MPQVQDQFAGHLLSADPRSLLFGARGSVWPTIPAYRYRAQSANATGSLTFLNGDGVLVTLFIPLPATGPVVWRFLSSQTPFPSVILIKQQTVFTRPGFQWIVGVTPEIDTGYTTKIIAKPLSKTNVDFDVGSIVILFPDPGDTGSTFQMRQVVWDETMPPV